MISRPLSRLLSQVYLGHENLRSIELHFSSTFQNQETSVLSIGRRPCLSEENKARFQSPAKTPGISSHEPKNSRYDHNVSQKASFGEA